MPPDEHASQLRLHSTRWLKYQQSEYCRRSGCGAELRLRTDKLGFLPAYNRESRVKRYLPYTVTAPMLYRVDNGKSKLTLRIQVTN